MNIKISIGKVDTQGIDRIRDKIDPAKLARGGATELAAITQRYLMRLNRHKTIDWLNARSKTTARPTHRYRTLAEGVRTETVGGKSVVVIPIPGISRAFRTLNIAPRNKPFLTVPVNSIAYGKSVADLRGEGWQMHRGKGRASVILFGKKDGEVRGLYALLKHVRVPQDRSLLPSDAQITSAVQRGAKSYIKSLNGK